MNLSLTTNSFDINYSESDINTPTLLESHCHFRFELIAIMSGSIDIVIEGHTYRCKRGDISIIPPLTYHNVTVSGESKYKRITALFDGGVLPQKISERLIDNVRASPIFSPASLPYLTDTLHGALEKGEPTSYSTLVDAIAMQMIYTCADEDISDRCGTEQATDTLKRAIEYVDLHITEKLSLESIAQALFISRSSLCHIFSERMQISPKQYIIQKKMAYANMLIENGASMTQAARAIGYDNYSNFYRMYRKNAIILE